MSLSKFKPIALEARAEPKVKIMIFGQYSSGKTHFALNSPGPIYYLDTEGSGRAFFNRPDFAHLKVDGNYLHTTSIDDVIEVLRDITSRNGKGVGTIIIDSLTTLYYNLQNANLGKKGKPETADWNVIKLKWKQFIALLANVEVNVVAIVQEKDGVKGTKVGGYMQYEGETKYDADKSTAYFADLGLRFLDRENGQTVAEVFKEDRFGIFKEGKTFKGLTFAKISEQYIKQSQSSAVAAETLAKNASDGMNIKENLNAVKITEHFNAAKTKEEAKGIYEELKGVSTYPLETLQVVFKEAYTRLPAAAA